MGIFDHRRELVGELGLLLLLMTGGEGKGGEGRGGRGGRQLHICTVNMTSKTSFNSTVCLSHDMHVTHSH